MPGNMGHDQDRRGDTTASGIKESCLGFPVLLCPRNTKSIGHFNSLQLDEYKNETFNKGSFYFALHSCCKYYPKSAQFHRLAFWPDPEEAERQYFGERVGRRTTSVCGAACSQPCNITGNWISVMEVSFINFSCPTYVSCTLWPIESFHLPGCFLVLCRIALVEGCACLI